MINRCARLAGSRAFTLPLGRVVPAVVIRVRAKSSVVSSSESVVSKEPEASSLGLANRFLVTTEVIISKIFPAGAGWQFGSFLAGDMGLKATDMSFALMTGLGDFSGVLLGHTAFYAIKSLFVKDIDVKQQAHTGFFLASAAFFSGTAWQPVVNTLQGAGYSYLGVTSITTIACAASFFAGLRLARKVYPSLGVKVAPNDYSNLKTDTSLSLSIGAACGGFVGTDTVYLPEQNFLKDFVGVDGADSTLTQMKKAGSATSIGFAVAQTTQNLTYAPKKNWTD